MKHPYFYIFVCTALGVMNGIIAKSNLSLISAWVSGWCLAFAAAKFIDILKENNMRYQDLKAAPSGEGHSE